MARARNFVYLSTIDCKTGLINNSCAAQRSKNFLKSATILKKAIRG